MKGSTEELQQLECEARNRSLFAKVSYGVVFHGPDGAILSANPAAARILGVSIGQLLGRSPADFIGQLVHEDGSPCSREDSQVMAALASGSPTEDRIMGILGPGRVTPTWMIGHAVPQYRPGESGPFQVCVTFRDITALKETFVENVTAQRQAEEALRASEAKYSTLFQILPTGVVLVDAAGTIMECNPAAERILGIHQAHCLSGTNRAPVWQILRPDGSPCPPEEYVTRRALRADRPVENVEQGMLRPDGSVSWHLASAAPIRVKGLGAALVAQDITDRRKAEAALVELNRVLEQRIQSGVAELRQRDQMLITQNRQAAMGEMIGNIAHQWRQPLNSLSMLLINLGDAQHYGALTEEKLKQALQKGDLIIQKMSSTINDFRNLCRPDRQRIRFSALAQIRGTIDMVEAGFAGDHIEVSVEAPEDVTLFGFPNEYAQVLLNLLGNARQAILEDRQPSGRIRIGLEREDGCGLLTVRDSGPGVPEERLEQIFEPYFSTRVNGTGIGLYMSRQIIEKNMSGAIRARNRAGATEFTVRVPAAAEGP